MLAYLPLIQQILLEFMTKKAGGHGFTFNLTGMGLLALSAILALMVLIFLLLALQTYTAPIYGVPQSWLITSAVTFLMGVIVYVASCFSRHKKGLITKVKEEVEDRLTPVAQIVEELAAPVKDHPLVAVLLAGLAGMMAAEKLNNRGTDN